MLSINSFEAGLVLNFHKFWAYIFLAVIKNLIHLLFLITFSKSNLLKESLWYFIFVNMKIIYLIFSKFLNDKYLSFNFLILLVLVMFLLFKMFRFEIY